MDLELKEKVVFVSAGSRGIGRACALTLMSEGAKVAICARDHAQLEATAKEIDELTGQRPFVTVADLADAEQIAKAIGEVEAALGPVDVLVANSVGPKPGVFADFSEADWLAAFDGAVLSTVRLIQAVLPAMVHRKTGSVVAVQSSSVKQPIPGLVLSNGVRPGVAGLMKSLAQEYGKHGLRFNTVCPGRILTERFLAVERAHGEPLDEHLVAKAAEVPLRRLGQPEEVADAVAFLASSRASYVTGSVLSVDGGNVRSLF